MKKMMTLAIAAVVAFPFLAFGQSEGYYDRSFTRLSYVKGDVYIQRAQDQGYEQGEVNLVVVAGDKLGTRDGRAEIQLGRGNIFRLDLNTQIDVAGLPARDGDPTKIHLLGGSVYFRVRELDREKNLQIHTPDASFYILEPGLYRLDVRENRRTEFSVYSGQAEAAGESGSVLVASGESIAALDGNLAGESTGLLARRDDFDSWNETRDGLYARNLSKSYLPETYSEYDYELSEYGDWEYEADYGYVWVPRIHDSGWRPYSNGRWVWYPIIGWTWVSYEPWGWCTSHYGRWGWGFGRGWYWIPTSYWSWGPAWVHWYSGYDYIGWCPLSYWGYPAVIVNNIFYGQYNDGWYDRGSYASYARSLTMVRRDQLQNRRLSDVALRGRAGVDFGRINLRPSQPDLRPSLNRDADLVNRARNVLDRGSLRQVGRDFSSRQGERPTRGFNDAGNVSPRTGESGRIIRNGNPADRGVGRESFGAGSAASPSRRSTSENPSSSRVIRERGTTATPSRNTSSVNPSSSRVIRERGTTATTSRSASSANPSSSRVIRERGTTATTSRSTSSSSRLSAPNRSASPSSSSARSSSVSRSTGTPSRGSSYSAPSRSSSSSRSYSAPSRSSSSSRSYSAPSRSSSSSRSYSAPSRSSSSSRSSSVSRSSSSSSSSRSSSRSSSSRPSSGSRSSSSGRRR